jgi:hypothetical protein
MTEALNDFFSLGDRIRPYKTSGSGAALGTTGKWEKKISVCVPARMESVSLIACQDFKMNGLID